MSQADEIRAYVVAKVVEPARQQHLTEIKVRAGDIHEKMGLKNRLPAVTAALGANKFERVARVTTLERSGPANGSNSLFRFRIEN